MDQLHSRKSRQAGRQAGLRWGIWVGQRGVRLDPSQLRACCARSPSTSPARLDRPCPCSSRPLPTEHSLQFTDPPPPCTHLHGRDRAVGFKPLAHSALISICHAGEAKQEGRRGAEEKRAVSRAAAAAAVMWGKRCGRWVGRRVGGSLEAGGRCGWASGAARC